MQRTVCEWRWGVRVQAALAFTVLHQAQSPLSDEGLGATVESLLEDRFGVRVRFNAEEGLRELQRLGLLESSEVRLSNRVC